MIAAIIFDIGGVYLEGLRGAEHILEPLLRIKPEEIYSQLRGKELTALFHGEITEDEYWDKIVKKSKWKITIGSLKKAVRENFKEIEGTRDIIEKLKEKRFKLGLLSVHAKEWVDYCDKKFGYHKLFHSILYSFEVAASKPDKKVYELILQKLKAKSEECIFIDDKENNLTPARELGIKTILFRGSNQLKKDLKSFGILVD